MRAWGRLGYPRRALRLHAAATAIVERHGGEVPSDRDALLALPGVGDYTASAVASFAFGDRHPVLDTNVRRVFARVVEGVAFPAPSVTAAERALAESLMPEHDAHRWAAATMELGALVCTARAPRCGDCPVADRCRWRAAGYPEHDGPPRRGQAWAGTDRQVRGRLMAVLREADGPVTRARAGRRLGRPRAARPLPRLPRVRRPRRAGRRTSASLSLPDTGGQSCDAAWPGPGGAQDEGQEEHFEHDAEAVEVVIQDPPTTLNAETGM